MLRYLTHKLKTQSLNEADSIPSKNDDDHDSGTESDDEGADAEELEKYMDDSLHCDVSSAALSDRASSTLDTITDTTEGGLCCSDASALPSDSDPNHSEANHSSEEELEVINCCAAARCPEKRKWSQANTAAAGAGKHRSSQLQQHRSSASDDEVRDLMCASAPVEFRASPPANVPKPSRSLSPPPKLFHHDAIPPHELCALSSPRKRHRRALLAAAAAAAAASTNPPDAAAHRPSLDFEKMQQKQKQIREGKI